MQKQIDEFSLEELQQTFLASPPAGAQPVPSGPVSFDRIKAQAHTQAPAVPLPPRPLDFPPAPLRPVNTMPGSVELEQYVSAVPRYGHAVLYTPPEAAAELPSPPISE